MNLRDLLSKKLSKDELANVNTAFDIVGDIAIIEIPLELEHAEKIIGEAVLELNKSAKVVVKKLGGHEGDFRIQQYKVICGEKRFVTEAKESNTRLKLDLNKTYYSVRLSTERLRIAKLIKPGEKILVIGAGAGPYPLVFVKNSSASKIVGVEMNPDSCELFTENVRLNKAKTVEVVCLDFLLFQSDVKFDRIVLSLPEQSSLLLSHALTFAKRGTIVHYYGFYHEDEFEGVIDFISSKAGNVKFLDLVKCGQKKPRVWRICQDFEVLY